MAKTAKHPYVAIVCPWTHTKLFAREFQTRNGWVWLHRGKQYDCLDDILDARRKKFAR